MTTDREDLERYLRGDAGAFDALIERHQATLLRFAQRQTGSAEVAQDAVQETFLRLLREAQSLAGAEQLGFWLLRVCRNLCTDVARKESRMQERHLRVAVADRVAPAPSALEHRETCDEVRRALEQLPAVERQVLILKVHEGRSYREISRMTGMTLHRVGSSLHRALRRVSVQLRSTGVV